jgi:hypothetical protein
VGSEWEVSGWARVRADDQLKIQSCGGMGPRRGEEGFNHGWTRMNTDF